MPECLDARHDEGALWVMSHTATTTHQEAPMTALIPIPGLTCTVGAPLAPCGAPAVVEFTVRGRRLGECEHHAPPFALREGTGSHEPTVVVGATVRVTHGGIVKVGRVVHVGRTRVRVEVPVVRTGGVKVIERPIAEVTVAR